MGVTLMEVGNHMRKGVMYSIKGCLHHPFLVFIVCGMIYISRAFPFMLSLLLSISPVVVCAAMLLGTLLYYGQQSIRETEKEMKSKYEGVSLRNHKFIDDNASVVEKDEKHFVEKCGESFERKLGEDSSLLGRNLGGIRVGGDGLSKGIRVGVDGSSKGRGSGEIESESSESGEESEGLGEHRVHMGKGEGSSEEKEREKEREGEGTGDGEVMADHYAIISKVIGELLESESEHEKSEGDSCDSERGNGEGEGEGFASGSESSSPDDTSVEDIMPTRLDELHPLLDEDAPQPAQMSHARSEASLNERSPGSSIESADETDVQESEAADDDENTEDHTKSVITWTEEDQKNLMEVGNSEIERNQRLERILRKRRNRSMVPEINMMELESSEFEFQIAPISTARRNPFDLPQDSVPGSAPSVLSRRRTNPFELPDELMEMGGESGVEIKASLSRRPFLRRRDNFSAVKIRPFFVAEQVIADESGYSPYKREASRQSSSGEETESVGSVEYFEDEALKDDADMNRGPVYDTDSDDD
ncbi:hypothetical protein AAHA92_00861 [Salvia divinorum]|uniref:Uncharacterized protein n=1 Tax=Salvia divinorum TaxID=28513 RepID=A0ABD1IKZ5_SALDI